MKAMLGLVLAMATAGCGAAVAQSSDVVVQIEGATTAKPTEMTEVVLHEPDETALVGDIRIDGDEISSSSKLVFYADSQARSVNLETFDRTLKQTEILEKRGSRVVRWKVEYRTAASLVTVNGQGEPDKNMPALRKPYIVDLRGPVARVTDENGRNVSKDEYDAVVRLEIFTKKKKPITQRPRQGQTETSLPQPVEHKVRTGDEVPWLAEYLERELSIETTEATLEAKVRRTKLVAIYEIDGDICAVVYVAMQLTRDEAKRAHTETSLEGQVVMRAVDGALIGMTVSGPQRTKGAMKTEQGILQYGGRGTIKLRMRRRWEVRGG
ncbi:MAG: hypothetical protein IPM54_37335 [Polyangiaceae bacterium]|nr:hypothetical protein [Polyangiaceae bacterium]